MDTYVGSPTVHDDYYPYYMDKSKLVSFGLNSIINYSLISIILSLRLKIIAKDSFIELTLTGLALTAWDDYDNVATSDHVWIKAITMPHQHIFHTL